MKHWHTQVFPIVLLAFLAGMSFWLQQSVMLPESEPEVTLRHDPDVIAENFEVKRFDEMGRIKYRLTAPYLVHYPDDDTSELSSPTLVSYQPNAPTTTLSSKEAKVAGKGETVFLWGNVVVNRAATSDRPALIATMPDLTVKPEEGIAFTHSPVQITQGLSWIKGVGAHINNNTSTLVLQSQVTGLYIRPGTTP